MRKMIAGAALGALVACSSYTPPRQPADVPRQVEIAAPAEDVWRLVIRSFSEYNIPIENIDRGSFFLKTKPVDLGTTYAGIDFGKEVPIRNGWCDCGSAALANVWSSETRIAVSFNIVLDSLAQSRTAVGTNTFFEGLKRGKRNLYASGYDTEMRLTCLSTGRVEREVAEFLRKNAAGRSGSSE